MLVSLVFEKRGQRGMFYVAVVMIRIVYPIIARSAFTFGSAKSEMSFVLRPSSGK